MGVCENYVDNNMVATIDIMSLRQPNYEKTTDSVQVFITSENDQFIAMGDEKMAFTPSRGSIELYSDALIKVVQESTMVRFELTPEHAIYVVDDPVIDIEFPQRVQINTIQCQIEGVSMTGSTGDIAQQCTRN